MVPPVLPPVIFNGKEKNRHVSQIYTYIYILNIISKKNQDQVKRGTWRHVVSNYQK